MAKMMPVENPEMSIIFATGYKVGKSQRSRFEPTDQENPYPLGSSKHKKWEQGWFDGCADRERLNGQD